MNDIKTLAPKGFPPLLREIPDAPEKLYVRGNIPSPSDHAFLCVVGSRKFSNYGRDVCEELIAGLRGYPAVIVSGLALGIDAIAHRAALKAGLPTIAVPGSGLNDDALYPATHAPLAREILDAGGALVSEFEPDFHATPWSFPQRNRIMAGMSHAVLIIEAGEKSGTLITARLALDYNRDVLVVPNSIFAEGSRGSNALIRHGAMPVAQSADIARELGLEEGGKQGDPTTDCTPEEKSALEALASPLSRNEFTRALGVSAAEASRLITTMEIKGLVKEEMGVVRRK